MVRVGDARDPARLGARLRLLWRRKIDLAEQLVDGARGAAIDHAALDRELATLRRSEPIAALASALEHLVHRSGVTLTEELTLDEREVTIFEGAQGVLLDRDHGFFLYVTPSRTTFAHADTLLAEARWAGAVTRVGVLRAHATRHGQGPFVTEDVELTAATPDLHNAAHAFQGAFRVGWFDVVAARYALRVVGEVDWLAITNLDRLTGLPGVRVYTAHDPGDGPSSPAGPPPPSTVDGGDQERCACQWDEFSARVDTASAMPQSGLEAPTPGWPRLPAGRRGRRRLGQAGHEDPRPAPRGPARSARNRSTHTPCAASPHSHSHTWRRDEGVVSQCRTIP